MLSLAREQPSYIRFSSGLLNPLHTSSRRTLRSVSFALLVAIASALPSPQAFALDVLTRVSNSKTLRVCIWPDYYGITWRDPRSRKLHGIDIDLSAAFAADLGVKLTYVDSTISALAEDLRLDRCDIAMSAVAVTPGRQRLMRFSYSYLQSDIYGVTTRSNPIIRSWEDIDQPGVNVGVMANTFMEPIMRSTLRHANLAVLTSPQTREIELQAGRIDVFLTSFPYGSQLLEKERWGRLIAPPAPFHPVPFAYAVKPGDDMWLEKVNTFVQQIKRDGRLSTAARRHHLTVALPHQ
jgi:cyclohexadienyl dehydratase